jgi:outer membrane protein assembly factor BamB
VVEAGPTGQPRPRRRQTVGVLVALAVLAVLGAGGVVASTWGEVDSEVYGYGGHLALPGAVTEKPDRDWTWDVPGSLTGLAATDDATYVATEDGDVTALDDAGHETWTTEVDGGGFLASTPDHAELVLFDNIADGKVTALSSDDGDRLWSADGDVQWFEDDRVYLATDNELSAYDVGSGDVFWTVTAHTIGVGQAGIFVVAGDQLQRLNTANGRTEWSVDVVRIGDETAAIAVADDFVAIGGTEATAYDATDGDLLWSSGSSDGAAVTLFSRDEVAVENVAGGGADIPVYDRAGRSGSIRTRSPLYLVPFRSGSDEYAFSLASGDLLGDDHEVVETYDGRPALAAEGVYALAEGKLSYYEWGATKPAWTLVDDDISRDANLQTGPGRFLVADGGELRSYS